MLLRLISFVLLVTAACVAWAEDRQLVGFEPGCYAKVYVGIPWPMTELTAGPAQVLRLDEAPSVDMKSVDKTRDGFPNVLIKSDLLDFTKGWSYYAVEYEGWIMPEREGVYTLSAQTDDHVEIFIEGKRLAGVDREVKNSEYHFSPEEKRTYTGERRENVAGSVKLSAGKWYHVSVICRQIYVQKHEWANSRYNGAHLKCWLQGGDKEAEPIPFHVPIYDE